MPDKTSWWNYRTSWNLFSTFVYLAVNVAVQPSSHSWCMDISSPHYRRRKMCDVLDLVVINSIRFSSSLPVS